MNTALKFVDIFVFSLLLYFAYGFYSQSEFDMEAKTSVEKQHKIEQGDTVSFEQFLEDYFADLK